MKISVVTCVYNRSLQAFRGLSTILRQSPLPLDEIVIIDDGSTDGFSEKIVELQNINKDININYEYIDFKEHRISSIPRNMGWKKAHGEIIIFTEPECLHVGNTIFNLYDKYAKEPTKSHLASQVWTIQEKIYGHLNNDDFLHPDRILNHRYAQLTDNSNMQNTKAPNSDWAITGEKNCNAGCLFLVKKEWLQDIGGFDESFEGHGFDDFDLFNRLALYGAGIIKHDDIAVIHQWHEKKYPYNIYEMAEKNGKISEDNIKKGVYKVNI